MTIAPSHELISWFEDPGAKKDGRGPQVRAGASLRGRWGQATRTKSVRLPHCPSASHHRSNRWQRGDVADALYLADSDGRLTVPAPAQSTT